MDLARIMRRKTRRANTRAADENLVLLSELAPSQGVRRAALAVAVLLLIALLSLLPFKNRQLPYFPAFIPIVDSIVVVNDLITAVLLYSQYSFSRQRRVLIPAMGYLFTALIVIPHLLAYPGAFTSTGLLGADPQTSVWLYVFARLGLPTAVILYSFAPEAQRSITDPPGMTISRSIAAVAVAVVALTWLAIHSGSLPPVMLDAVHGSRFWSRVVAPGLLIVHATSLVLLWRRRSSLLDTWLLVALWSWSLEILILNFNTSRYSLFWYSAIFGLIGSSVVLLFLLYESTLLYARLALVAAVRNKEGERQRLALHVVANSFAHELKQPLTAILGNAEAMQQALARGAPDPSQARELIADIVSESLRADNIITATRSMLKGAERPAESVRIDQLVSESLAVLRTDSGMQCVSIQMEVPADLPAVKGNKGQLMQVLINLISNALDAMQEVTDRPRVLSIRSSVLEGAMIALIVGDSGRGIEPQNMPRIFEPFFTTSPRGTGIGLAICRLIIEAHGGRISASSARESGSTFEICLPIA